MRPGCTYFVGLSLFFLCVGIRNCYVFFISWFRFRSLALIPYEVEVCNWTAKFCQLLLDEWSSSFYETTWPGWLLIGRLFLWFPFFSWRTFKVVLILLLTHFYDKNIQAVQNASGMISASLSGEDIHREAGSSLVALLKGIGIIGLGILGGLYALSRLENEALKTTTRSVNFLLL